jgi:hypothetical protein
MMRRAPVVHIYHGSEENKQYKVFLSTTTELKTRWGYTSSTTYIILSYCSLLVYHANVLFVSRSDAVNLLMLNIGEILHEANCMFTPLSQTPSCLPCPLSSTCLRLGYIT